MSALLIIIVIVLLTGLGGGAAVWIFFRTTATTRRPGPPPSTVASSGPVFCWRYAALPITSFLISILLVGSFYRLLSAEVAYHFAADGSPDGWLSRGAIVAWTLLPQALLMLLAVGITWGIARLGASVRAVEASGVKLNSVLLTMGNMIGLPQIILCFAMADAFSYNAYGVHILPLWVFVLIVATVGAVILGAFFVQSIRRVLKDSG